MPHFGKTSRKHLATCDEQIKRVLNRAIQFTDFSVTCGYRSLTDQQAAYEAGFSKLQYPHSKHNLVPSRAVDVAPYPIDWADWERFYYLAGVILYIADSLRIPLRWGGHWTTFQDLPHFELR